MIIWLEIETWVIGKDATKRGQKEGRVGGERYMGASGFCGPCVCLGVFPLL
jgi:hypothetical protein